MIVSNSQESNDLTVEPLELLVGADDAYAMPLAVTLFSALEHLTPGRHVNVTVIDGGLAESNRERITSLLRHLPIALVLNWIKPDPDSIRQLPVGTGNWDYISMATHFRLFAPELIATSRVIYLDSDVVVQKNLEPLWMTELADYAVAAVTELGTTLPGGQERYRAAWQQQQLDPYKPHFNAGVLLINLAKWRAEKIPAAYFDNTRRYQGNYQYPNQDGLNAVLYGDWLELDNRWNFQVTYGELKHKPVPVEKVAILHYSTRAKPWKELASRGKGSYYRPFLQALERSRWFSPTEYLRFRAHLTFTFMMAKIFHHLAFKSSSSQ